MNFSRCNNCGAEAISESNVCLKCGAKQIKEETLETCSYKICNRKLEEPYVPIELTIRISWNITKIDPETYSGRFCSWLCADKQQDIWIQNSKHV